MDEEDAKLRKQLEGLKHRYALEYEMIRAIAAFEHAVLRPLFLLNGGGLVVYLGLLGALRRAGGADGGLDWCIGRYAALSWACGLLLATIATFAGGFSQFFARGMRGDQVALEEIRLGLARDHDPADEVAERIKRNKRWGDWGRNVAIAAGIVSLALFALGLVLGFESILN